MSEGTHVAVEAARAFLLADEGSLRWGASLASVRARTHSLVSGETTITSIGRKSS